MEPGVRAIWTRLSELLESHGYDASNLRILTTTPSSSSAPGVTPRAPADPATAIVVAELVETLLRDKASQARTLRVLLESREEKVVRASPSKERTSEPVKARPSPPVSNAEPAKPEPAETADWRARARQAEAKARVMGAQIETLQKQLSDLQDQNKHASETAREAFQRVRARKAEATSRRDAGELRVLEGLELEKNRVLSEISRTSPLNSVSPEGASWLYSDASSGSQESVVELDAWIRRRLRTPPEMKRLEPALERVFTSAFTASRLQGFTRNLAALLGQPESAPDVSGNELDSHLTELTLALERELREKRESERRLMGLLRDLEREFECPTTGTETSSKEWERAVRARVLAFARGHGSPMDREIADRFCALFRVSEEAKHEALQIMDDLYYNQRLERPVVEESG